MRTIIVKRGEMFPSDLPPKSPINYRALLVDKPDNSAYLDAIARVKAAYRQAEVALGGPVEMTMTQDPKDGFIYNMKFTRK